MSIRMNLAATNFSPDSSTEGTPLFSPLLSLVYVSAAAYLFDNAELEAILKKSRENNQQLGVSGMLLYYDGAVIQVLEGPEATVRHLYARISQDPRHHRITRLLEEYIPERNFPDWSMGYHRLTNEEMQHLDGFTSFVETDQFLAYLQEKPQKSLMLLQSFRKSSKR